tara:strand:- start:2863 stop:3438 length:576 start_codon:yes stop_codon:yes gene_type:complete
MLSHIRKFTLIFFLLTLLPYLSFSQNKQNRYYNPIRFSVSGLTKFVVGPNDHFNSKYLFDHGIGLVGELIYTLDQKAKYEISIEAGIMRTFSNPDNSSTEKPLIPVTINAYYYFFDEEFSPFIGVGFGAEYLHTSKKYLLEPILKTVIGISNNNLKVFGRYGILKSGDHSIEIGIGYSFKERPCGCFPQSN